MHAASVPAAAPQSRQTETSRSSLVCRTSHTLPMHWSASRAGYRHFGRAHKMACGPAYDCRACQAKVELNPLHHRLGRVAQLAYCDRCHRPQPVR